MYQNIASIWVKYFVFATLNGIKKISESKIQYNISCKYFFEGQEIRQG